MRLGAHRPLLGRLLAGLVLLAGFTGLLIPAASAATTKPMPRMDGWIRLAHLSPTTPAVDVYLYPFRGSPARVLHHVPYGIVSPYMKVAPGQYTVAMRTAGAPSGSTPKLSASVKVVAGDAYTVAGMGRANGVRLRVLRDQLMPPKGKILIRVIQASMAPRLVTVTAGKEMLARKLAFPHLTGYRVANPGMWTFRAIGAAQRTWQRIRLNPNCIHTIVILDDPGHLKIDDLLDTAGSMVMPKGGVMTGLGGTAPRPASPAAPWLMTMAAGALLALAGGGTIRRFRHRPLHAR